MKKLHSGWIGVTYPLLILHARRAKEALPSCKKTLSTTANMKMADFREIVTTVPFILTIINLTIILGKKSHSDNFGWF